MAYFCARHLHSGISQRHCYACEVDSLRSENCKWEERQRQWLSENALCEEENGNLRAENERLKVSREHIAAGLTAAEERITKLEAAITQLVSAMEMQEGRELGEFHIPQPTAKHIWDEAKATAAAALRGEENKPCLPTE